MGLYILIAFVASAWVFIIYEVMTAPLINDNKKPVFFSDEKSVFFSDEKKKETKMKVIQVYKPLQNSDTKDEDLELVEFVTTIKDENIVLKNVVPHWNVRSEMLKHNETYLEWLLRKKEQISNREDVEGIYLYDVTIVDGITGLDENNQFGMIVRYDYIKTT